MLAHELNRACHCVTADRTGLVASLRHRFHEESALDLHSLFAPAPIFIDETEVRAITAAVDAIQRVVEIPAFRRCALERAPSAASVDQGTRGVLYGYDFHLTDDGPRLIEINTNAGGALLNLELATRQAPCCDAIAPFLLGATGLLDAEDDIVQSFRDEFARARGAGQLLERIAIVDERPASQFLYAEFLLFQQLLRAHGIDTHLADPSELSHHDGGLWLGERRIDLVYNRLTDFYFEAPENRVLGEAYAAGHVVVTPHPRAHALFADKRHLAVFSRDERLAELGVDAATRELLVRVVPQAELVTPDNVERLWSDRRRFFFKPLSGFGSKAAYRGDKLTRKAWQHIASEPYLAQEVVMPSERVLDVDGVLTSLKLDVRAYVNRGRVVLFAARLYQGQTTNFRTRGGGFASVLATPG